MPDEEVARLNEHIAKLEGELKNQERASVLLVRRDIELARALEKLKTIESEKSKFISVAAHQLRTPLSAIRWGLEYMLTPAFGLSNDKQRTLLMKTLETNVRLIRIVNELLDVDRIETKREQFSYEDVEPHDLLASVLFDLHPTAQHGDVRLELCSGAASAGEIRIDKKNLRTIFQNLIENAIKYTPGGGRVTVCLTVGNSQLEFSVSDTGIGIPFDEQKNLFRKFFRATNAMKRQTDGSGLGLYLVSELVKNMNGTITCSSEVDVGTTFTVVLPVDKKPVA